MSAPDPSSFRGGDQRGFPDHFSRQAAAYARHRPRYPDALLNFLADAAPSPGVAWDAGCGSGQLSCLLAGRFERVEATDASPEQVERARPHPLVRYRVAHSSHSGIESGTVDLAVAAQAAHWFALGPYYAEVTRVARPGALIALVSYAGVVMPSPVGPLLDHFRQETLRPWWPPQRALVETAYRTLPFPFRELRAPRLEMRAEWTLPQLTGYLGTWSAVQALESDAGLAPLQRFHRELAEAWGPAERVREIRWPLAIRAGRV